MLHLLLTYALPIILGIVVLVFLYNSIVIVGGTSICILERRWIGKDMPKNRTVALKNEVGLQARTLGPGFHFLTPFLYKTKKTGFWIVGPNEVDTCEAITGDPIPSGRMFADMIDCDLFQDGETFLTKNGQKGPQIQILPPGQYRINPYLFRMNNIDQTIIKNDEVGVVTAKDGAPVPAGKIFAKTVECNYYQDVVAFFKNGGQKGPQTLILPPGPYRINTELFKVTPMQNVVVKQGEVATVTAMDGDPIATGRLLAKFVEEHNNFEDGDAFLNKGGQKGPQAQILLPGTYRVNRSLFIVEIQPATIIPALKVGLVTAKDGEPLPQDELMAKSIENHDDFQNVAAFLTQKGQRGPQLDILKPGTYYINPLMFDVVQEDIAEVKRGQVAVIISNVGKEPEKIKAVVAVKADVDASKETTDQLKEEAEKRLDEAIERYVVPRGYRGIQDEVTGPGIYYLNRRAFIAHIVDTTNITVDWDEGGETKFDPLKIISKDAFEISVSVKVIFRVRPDQAPHMIAKIGSIDNLINHVIHPMIDSSFRNQASSTSAMNFMQDRDDEQRKAEERTRKELEKYHVQLVSVLICQIKLPEKLMDTQTAKVIAQQEQIMYVEQEKSQKERINMEKTTAQANKQPELVAAEIDVQIADQKKKKNITESEGEKEAIINRKTGDAEGDKIIGLNIAAVKEAQGVAEGKANAAIGKGLAEGYEEQKKAIGEKGIITIEVAKALAGSNLKLVPDILFQSGDNGGSGIGELLSTFLVQKITNDKKPDTEAEQK